MNRSLGCPEAGIICVKVPPEGGVPMRRIIGDAARAVAVYLAWVLGGAAVGALVGQLGWGQWFLGALAAGTLVAWFALPTGSGRRTGAHGARSSGPPRRPGANEKKTNALLTHPRPSFMRTRLLASISAPKQRGRPRKAS